MYQFQYRSQFVANDETSLDNDTFLNCNPAAHSLLVLRAMLVIIHCMASSNLPTQHVTTFLEQQQHELNAGRRKLRQQQKYSQQSGEFAGDLFDHVILKGGKFNYLIVKESRRAIEFFATVLECERKEAHNGIKQNHTLTLEKRFQYYTNWNVLL